MLDNILSSTALKDSAEPTLPLPFTVLRPVPAALVPTFMTKRKTKLKTFQAWRKAAKEKRSGATEHSSENEGLYNQLQLSGRITMSKSDMTVSLTSTFLVLALDNQVVDACVGYCQEILKYKEQLEREIEELRKQLPRTSTRLLSDSRGLEPADTVTDRQRFVMTGDFGLGCIRLCCSVNGKQLSTISLTRMRGNFEHQGGNFNSQTAEIAIEDVIVGLVLFPPSDDSRGGCR